MKRFAYITLAVLSMACSRNGVEIVEKLSIEGDGPATKVALSENSTVWESGDMASVFFDGGANECWTYSGNGTLSHVASSVRSTQVKKYALYPYSSNNTLTEGVLKSEIPSSQTYRDGACGTVIMACESETDSLAFKYAAGYVAVDVTGIGTIKSATFTPVKSMIIAGPADISFSSGEPNLKMSFSARSTSISLTGEESTIAKLSDSKAVTLYFCLPPMTLSDGFNLTLTFESGTVATYSFNGRETITRGHVSRRELRVLDEKEMTSINLDFTGGESPFTEAVPTGSTHYDETVSSEYAEGKKFTTKSGGYDVYVYTKSYLTNTYGFYYSSSKAYMVFGRQGSFIKFPKIEGKTLYSVTYRAGSTAGNPVMSSDKNGTNAISCKIGTTVAGEEYLMEITGAGSDSDYYWYVTNGNICFYWIKLLYIDN